MQLQKKLNQFHEDNSGQYKPFSQQGDADLKNILLQIAETQSQIAQKMSPTFQIFSTSDTCNAIPLFGGNKTDNATEWIKQVERIASLANWSQNLMLVNESTRLRGPAQNWHKVVGKNINNWIEWREKISEHFMNRMSFAEFIMYQSQRTLKSTETICDYIYIKNAMLEKSSTKIPDADRVSLILKGQSQRYKMVNSSCCTVLQGSGRANYACDGIGCSKKSTTI
ncbi:unnamed protein product [Danaus chrysippus]|uniref:(African queen) hypothetical protein n=1 Tax=Danaus chrysippus TaxID=151541 RepID=A0A8J2W9M6_9NEOP|nr:unnamed protein product [Danaus chrysippus]